MNELKTIPVVDILNGVAVQAIGGQRDHYRPIRSQLTDSVDPSIVLARMSDVCQSDTAYIADLDAILREQPNRCTLAELSRMPLNLMVDVGVRSCEDVQMLLDLGFSQAIIALESLPGPTVAKELLQTFDPQSLILSLDMKASLPMSCWEPWAELPPLELLMDLAAIGFRRWILLDLSAVGTHTGVPTTELCRSWRTHRPQDEIITGGGIRSITDLSPLEQAGVNGVLIASALHNGAITQATDESLG